MNIAVNHRKTFQTLSHRLDCERAIGPLCLWPPDSTAVSGAWWCSGVLDLWRRAVTESGFWDFYISLFTWSLGSVRHSDRSRHWCTDYWRRHRLESRSVFPEPSHRNKKHGVDSNHTLDRVTWVIWWDYQRQMWPWNNQWQHAKHVRNKSGSGVLHSLNGLN